MHFVKKLHVLLTHAQFWELAQVLKDVTAVQFYVEQTPLAQLQVPWAMQSL